MQATTSNIRDAVDNLPPGAVLTLDNVSWDEYESVLEQFVDRSGLRITYDQGRLDFVTTSRAHGKREFFIARMVAVLAEELNIDIEGDAGSTHKRKRYLKGTEPDTCFYIGNLERIAGKEEINLETDPPPDLVIEVDKSHQSLRKLPIYAAFGVPEIWRYLVRQKTAEIHALQGETYARIPASRFFPILTNAVLARFVEQSAVEGQTPAIKAFRRWIKGRKQGA
ncbi:MAG TPA: Uma2 family endonuclease [Terriglobia bacterium]|jgi:Uma2 family endonuclease